MTRTKTRLLWVVLALGLVVFAVTRWVLVPYRVTGGSMRPTLVGGEDGAGGDVVLVNRWAYAGGAPSRWDVVALTRPDLRERVKRVVGLPGETVEIQEGMLHVNGAPVPFPDGFQGEPLVRKGEFGFAPVRLGEGEYFVLGDASYLSVDSRRWGPVRREDIAGRVVLVLLPLARMGRVP